MMKILLISLFAIACVSARIDNRSPKNGAVDEDRPRVSLDFCQECKDVVIQIRTILDDPDKFAQLQTDLRIVCAALGPYSDACINMVNNLPFVIHQIRPLLTNETATCISMEMCGASNVNTGAKKLAVLLIRKHLLQSVPSSAVGVRNNDMVCEECIFAMTELKSLLQDKSIQDQVKQFLYGICAKLGSMAQECDEMMDQYLPLVFSEVTALLDNPRAVCTDAGLCTGARGSLIASIMTRLARVRGHLPHHQPRERMSVHTENGIELPTLELMLLKSRTTKGMFSAGCTICETMMRKVKNFLMNDSSGQVAVIDSVKKLCNKMPTEVKVQCIDFLDVYGQAVLIVAIDQMSPQKVCQKLGACDARESKKLQKLWKMNENYRNDVECEACFIVMSIVQRELQEPEMQTEITNLVKRLCTHAPSAYVSECNDAVDQFLPALLSNLSRLGADQVCPAISMCPATESNAIEA